MATVPSDQDLVLQRNSRVFDLVSAGGVGERGTVVETGLGCWANPNCPAARTPHMLGGHKQRVCAGACRLAARHLWQQTPLGGAGALHHACTCSDPHLATAAPQVREAASPLEHWQQSHHRWAQVSWAAGREQLKMRHHVCRRRLQAAPLRPRGTRMAAQAAPADALAADGCALVPVGSATLTEPPLLSCPPPCSCMEAPPWWTAAALRARSASTCRQDGVPCRPRAQPAGVPAWGWLRPWHPALRGQRQAGQHRAGNGRHPKLWHRPGCSRPWQPCDAAQLPNHQPTPPLRPHPLQPQAVAKRLTARALSLLDASPPGTPARGASPMPHVPSDVSLPALTGASSSEGQSSIDSTTAAAPVPTTATSEAQASAAQTQPPVMLPSPFASAAAGWH